jgi:hypothetical protein
MALLFAVAISGASTGSGSTCSVHYLMRALEEKRPRWGVRTSNPGGAVKRSLVGSTPILFRQFIEGAMMQTEAPALDLIASFQQAAEEARHAEDAYRREAGARIDALARERANAFRRLNFVRTAAAAIADNGEQEMVMPRARLAVADALGWSEIGPRQALVLDRLVPVFAAMQDEMAEGVPGAASQDALRTFEDWYRAETGTEFYALFERYIPDTPRVDF